jgi:CYTH domain-containing protein
VLGASSATEAAVAVEIERKFVLPGAPERLAGIRPARIDQGYLAVDGSTEVRLRRSGERTLGAARRHG